MLKKILPSFILFSLLMGVLFYSVPVKYQYLEFFLRLLFICSLILMVFSAIKIRIIHKFLHLPIISFFLIIVFVPFSFRYLKTSKLELKCIGVVIEKNAEEMSIDVRNRYDIVYTFTHLPKETYDSIEKSDYFEKQAWENFCKVKNKKLKLLK